jgi:hypothetical protein
MKCSACGLEVHPGARFCGHCGARVPDSQTHATDSSPPAETPVITPTTAHPTVPEDTPTHSEARHSAPPASVPPYTAAPATASADRPGLHRGRTIAVAGIAAAAAFLIVLAFVAIRAYWPSPQASPTLVVSASMTPGGPNRTASVTPATPTFAPTPPMFSPETTSATPIAAANYIDTFLGGQPCAHCSCLYKNGDASPLIGTGSSFESNGSFFHIDPRLIVAIAGQETSFGLHTCCSHNNNAWNWFWCYADNSCQGRPCEHSPFDSWNSGIKTVSKYMKKNYLSHGYDTIDLIGHKYCIDNCSAWVGGVTRFYQQLGGDPAHIAPPI